MMRSSSSFSCRPATRPGLDRRTSARRTSTAKSGGRTSAAPGSTGSTPSTATGQTARLTCPRVPNHPADATLNYAPTVNPAASGGYAWVIFTSRRLYGNVATIDPFSSDPRSYDYAHQVTTKKLWVAAVDLGSPPGVDPSHPAFYLPAQELRAGQRARVLGARSVPCRRRRPVGQETSAAEGYCQPVGAGDKLVCADQDPDVRSGWRQVRDGVRLLRPGRAVHQRLLLVDDAVRRPLSLATPRGRRDAYAAARLGPSAASKAKVAGPSRAPAAGPAQPMTTHSQSSHPPRRGRTSGRAAGALPRPRRRRRRRDWGRGVARSLCAVLALVGALPFVATLVVRSAWARDWAARETQRLLREQGIVATYAPSLRVWPLAVELDRVRVESSDGGAPVRRVRSRRAASAALRAARGQARHRPDRPRRAARPRRRARRQAREPRAQAPARAPRREGPLHAPFNTFSVTDGAVRPRPRRRAPPPQSIDLDVTADDDPALGSSFETALRVGRANVQRPRARAPTGRSRATTTRSARSRDACGSSRAPSSCGASRASARPTSTPPRTRRRRAICPPTTSAASSSRSDTCTSRFPRRRGRRARDRRPRARARADRRSPSAPSTLPETDGWVGVDADVRYARGHHPARTSRDASRPTTCALDQYTFAHELTSELTIRRNVIESPKTTLHFAGGTLVLSDTVVDPLGKGGAPAAHPARRDGRRLHRADARPRRPPELVGRVGHPRDPRAVDLGHVRAAQDRRRLHGEDVHLRRLRPARPTIARASASSASPRRSSPPHFAVRPDALKFIEVRAVLPHSRIDGGFCSIGFHNDLQRRRPARSRPTSTTCRPSGNVSDARQARRRARTSTASSTTRSPWATSPRSRASRSPTSRSAISARARRGRRARSPRSTSPACGPSGARAPTRCPTRHAALRRRAGLRRRRGGRERRLRAARRALDVRARRRPALRRARRHDGGARRRARRPRRSGGRVRRRVHLASTPRGTCANVVALRRALRAGRRRRRPSAGTTASAGIAGADVDLRSFVLDKVQPPTGTRAGATGTVLGSASIRRGGALAANVMLEGVPLSRVDALGRFASQVEGQRLGGGARHRQPRRLPARRRASSRAPRSTCRPPACAASPCRARTST